MIQISDTTTPPSRNLDEICEEHYSRLRVLIIRRIAENTPALQVFLSDHLEEILKGKPEQLIALHEAYRAEFQNNYNLNLKEIFNYKSFSDKNTTYSAYTLAKKLNFNTCPYCNRNYTVTVDRNKKIVRPDFDHFFPQSRYPLLALSFFNLIPCCPICNRTLKGNKKMEINTHIHPYLEGFGQVLRFNYLPGDTDSAVGMQNNFNIRLLGPDAPKDVDKLKLAKCRRNTALFQLEPIYTESHSAEVAEIVYKHHVSNGSYLRSLAETFPKIGGRDELYRLAFGNYYQEGDFDKRPLAKLTRDIFDQLNFLW